MKQDGQISHRWPSICLLFLLCLPSASVCFIRRSYCSLIAESGLEQELLRQWSAYEYVAKTQLYKAGKNLSIFSNRMRACTQPAAVLTRHTPKLTTIDGQYDSTLTSIQNDEKIKNENCGAGHSLYLSKPERVAEVIEALA